MRPLAAHLSQTDPLPSETLPTTGAGAVLTIVRPGARDPGAKRRVGNQY